MSGSSGVAGWVVCGCLAAGLGSLGVVAMVHHGAGATAAAGQELADSLAVLLTSGGAAIALASITCLGSAQWWRSTSGSTGSRRSRGPTSAPGPVGQPGRRGNGGCGSRRLHRRARRSWWRLPRGPLPRIGELMLVVSTAGAGRQALRSLVVSSFRHASRPRPLADQPRGTRSRSAGRPFRWRRAAAVRHAFEQYLRGLPTHAGEGRGFKQAPQVGAGSDARDRRTLSKRRRTRSKPSWAALYPLLTASL